MEWLQTEVLVVGGGTGGTAAALQAARRGVQTIVVSEGPWLGGMLTSSGVSVPDGNELLAWQTGLWGQFLRSLQQRQASGLDHSWVSFFAYEPKVGAAIFADWVKALPNLHWIAGQRPQAVKREGDRLTAVVFDRVTITAQIILDGTELGDVLALGDVPYRWGWEPQEQWQEPSAPPQADLASDPFFQRSPVQSPTWVVLLQDYGDKPASKIVCPPDVELRQFEGAWARHGQADFISYGQLPGRQFMLNWPIHGNDYAQDLNRLIGTQAERETVWQAAIAHSQAFAHVIQAALGDRYGLALDAFPAAAFGGGALALQPYYRESRRLQGVVTVVEQDLLPLPGGQVAPLPLDETGQVAAIALGNYANDHHYPGRDWPLAPKSTRWGGFKTGTPFALPYGCLVPAAIDGLLVCEKNISVSHMANGATRLQPMVLGLGQAAGMAAALCIERGCQPRDLPVRVLQTALLSDSQAPQAVIPLFNLPPDHPDWLVTQQRYLDRPETYPLSGNVPDLQPWVRKNSDPVWQGTLRVVASQTYQLLDSAAGEAVTLLTLDPAIDAQLQVLKDGETVAIAGVFNQAGRWLRATGLPSS